jgi:hypothetical protein
MFLGHPDPDQDLLARGMDPDPAPDLSLFTCAGRTEKMLDKIEF